MYYFFHLATYESLKKMALRQKQLNASINTSGTTKVPDSMPPQPPNKRNNYGIKPTSKRNNQLMINRRAKKILIQSHKSKSKAMHL